MPGGLGNAVVYTFDAPDAPHRLSRRRASPTALRAQNRILWLSKRCFQAVCRCRSSPDLQATRSARHVFMARRAERLPGIWPTISFTVVLSSVTCSSVVPDLSLKSTSQNSQQGCSDHRVRPYRYGALACLL